MHAQLIEGYNIYHEGTFLSFFLFIFCCLIIQLLLIRIAMKIKWDGCLSDTLSEPAMPQLWLDFHRGDPFLQWAKWFFSEILSSPHILVILSFITSVRIVDVRADVWTQDLPNMKQKCYPLGRDVRSFAFLIAY